MSQTIFTQIIDGSVPSHKVYEDERVYAFMDIHPIQPGQVLVVPRKPVPYIWDLPTDDYQALMTVVQRLGQRIREVFPDSSHVGIHVEGLDVPHTHVKIFPFSSHAEFVATPDGADPDHIHLSELAKKLQID